MGSHPGAQVKDDRAPGPLTVNTGSLAGPQQHSTLSAAAARLLDGDPDVVGFLDVGPESVRRVVRDAVEARRWRVIHSPEGHEAIAVNPRHRWVGYGWLNVHDAPRTGTPRPRGLLWAGFVTPGGVYVTAHVTHWGTALADGKGAHLDLVDAALANAKHRSGGWPHSPHVSYLLGDFLVDVHDDGITPTPPPFQAPNLRTVWDPNGRPIALPGRRALDAVAVYDPQSLTAVDSVNTGTDGGRRQLSARYCVTL